MLVVSNHIVDRIDAPKHAIIRINMAWIKNADELEILLNENMSREVFLDCPCGRKKPPKPAFMLHEAIEFSERFENIKYLAISNVEDPKRFKKIKNQVKREDVKLVPKIETEKGVKNIVEIMFDGNTDVAMLDKEDLYTDVKQNAEVYKSLVEEARSVCKANNLILIELEGVIFSEHK